MKVPADNASPTPEKAALGKQLFFDKRLGKDNAFSCETCHVPEKGWTDGEALSKKADGKMNTRHSPTMINVGYNELWYWDGRAETLEKQVEAAWKGQMGAEPAEVAKKLGKIPGYAVQFKTIFGNAEPKPDDIVKALASFVRTIRSGDSPWDKHEKGDKAAVGKEVEEGWKLFRDRGRLRRLPRAAALHRQRLLRHRHRLRTSPSLDVGRGKPSKDEKLERRLQDADDAIGDRACAVFPPRRPRRDDRGRRRVRDERRHQGQEPEPRSEDEGGEALQEGEGRSSSPS